MRVHHLICERIERLDTGDGREAILYVNPTANALVGLLNRANPAMGRGLIVGPDVYFWSSVTFTHDEIGKLLGMRRVPPVDRIYVDVYDGKRVIHFSYRFDIKGIHPQVLPLLRSGLFLIYDPEQHRPLAYPEVRQPALAEEAPKRFSVTDTPEFQRWFAGSKIVDAEGKPLMMFHGTSNDIDFKSFKVPRNGAWFTNSRKEASDYAENNDNRGNVRGYDPRTGFITINHSDRVVPVYIRAVNPLYITDWPDSIAKANNYKRAQGEWFDQLRREGHDAVVFRDMLVVTVLGSPTQIKSAIGNRTFDPNKKGLTEQVVYDEFVPGSGHLKVIRNPSRRQFLNFLGSIESDARAILTDDAIYVWDSYVATHGEVAGILGIRGYELVLDRNGVQFRGVGQTNDNYDDATPEDEEENEGTAAWIASETPIVRLYGPKPEVRIYYP